MIIIHWKKNWPTFLLIAVILYLITIIFNGCEAEKLLRQEAKASKEYVNKLQADLQKKDQKFKEDSLYMENYLLQYDSIINDLYLQLDEKQGTVNRQFTRIKRLTRQADSVRLQSDTTAYSRKMDSAAREFDQLALRYADLEKSMDELISAQITKDSTNEAFITALKLQLESTRNAFNDLAGKYNLLYKDFKTVARKSKNRQLLNKILAAGVLGTGGALILNR